MNISELYGGEGGREVFALTMIIWILNGCMDVFRECVLGGSGGGLSGILKEPDKQ